MTEDISKKSTVDKSNLLNPESLSTISKSTIELDPKKNPEAALDQKIKLAKLPAAIGALMPREQRIINARFGLDSEAKTLEEVGKELGVTKERVRQLEIRAIRKLRREMRPGPEIPTPTFETYINGAVNAIASNDKARALKNLKDASIFLEIHPNRKKHEENHKLLESLNRQANSRPDKNSDQTIDSGKHVPTLEHNPPPSVDPKYKVERPYDSMQRNTPPPVDPKFKVETVERPITQEKQKTETRLNNSLRDRLKETLRKIIRW